MEFETKSEGGEEDLTNKSQSSSMPFKPQIQDGFCFSSSTARDLFPDLHHLHHHHQFSISGSPENPESEVRTGCFDPFNPFRNGGFFPESGGNDATNVSAMQNFQCGAGGGGGGYLDSLKKAPATIKTGLPFNCRDIEHLNFVIADEGSCISAAAAAENGFPKEVGMKQRSGAAPASPPTRRLYKGHKETHLVKGQWTIEEDRALIHLVEKYGERKWSYIAQMLTGRVGKQCRERWHNHLRPDIKKDTWTEEEDKILIEAHAAIGNKWAEIAKRLPGRTENSIKNHWNATKRRQLSKQKCRSKHPGQSSLLQDYIQSLTPSDGSRSSASVAPTTTPPPPPPAIKTALPIRQTTSEESSSTDRLVPNCDDFDDHEDLPLEEEELLNESSADDDSLVDQTAAHPLPPPLDGDGDEKRLEMMNMGSFMRCEVKKELDLMEIITQTNL